jgi:hypothetical protein
MSEKQLAMTCCETHATPKKDLLSCASIPSQRIPARFSHFFSSIMTLGVRSVRFDSALASTRFLLKRSNGEGSGGFSLRNVLTARVLK